MHAGLVACRLKQRWRGALITGPSGAGKSDLMLRLLAQGFRLVADDRALVWVSGGRLYGRAPDTLHGLIEARGVGVLGQPALPLAEIVLIAACEAGEAELERIPPQGARQEVEGLSMPLLRLRALEASAPAKLRLALGGR